MFKKLIVQILTNSIAIYVAASIVPGIRFSENSFPTILMAGFVFGLINFFIKPILQLVSLPLILLTFGLFTFVINVVMLLLLAHFVKELTIDGPVAAFWGMVVISVVNIFVGSFLKK